MALIRFTVDLTNPALPKVISDDVLNVFPGDRLEFVSNPPGIQVAVELGHVHLLNACQECRFQPDPGRLRGNLCRARTRGDLAGGSWRR